MPSTPSQFVVATDLAPREIAGQAGCHHGPKESWPAAETLLVRICCTLAMS